VTSLPIYIIPGIITVYLQYEYKFNQTNADCWVTVIDPGHHQCEIKMDHQLSIMLLRQTWWRKCRCSNRTVRLFVDREAVWIVLIDCAAYQCSLSLGHVAHLSLTVCCVYVRHIISIWLFSVKSVMLWLLTMYCYLHMPIGKVWIYRLMFVILFVCMVTDFSAEVTASGI